MKRPTELIEKAKGFKSTDPIRVLAEYAVSLEQPRKTVSDAVEALKNKKPKILWTHVRCHEKDGFFFCCGPSGDVPGDSSYCVCTREEFEAEVERRKGEEWTHKSKGGKLCKVVYEDNETQLVYFSDGSRSCYWDAEHFAVKRKTISKAEVDSIKAYHAWMKGRFVVDPDEYLEQFEVK